MSLYETSAFASRLVAAALAGTILSGCASHPVRLPMGKWRGEGVYAFATQPGGPNADTSKSISASDHYPTTLTISRGKLGDRDVIQFEVVSKHENGPGVLKEDVHMRMALEESTRIGDDCVIYRVLASTFNSDEELKPLSDQPAPSASCLRIGPDVVFQVNDPDAEGMSESYRFHGDRLDKFGTFYAPKEEGEDEVGLIHWTETLHRRGWGGHVFISVRCCR